MDVTTRRAAPLANWYWTIQQPKQSFSQKTTHTSHTEITYRLRFVPPRPAPIVKPTHHREKWFSKTGGKEESSATKSNRISKPGVCFNKKMANHDQHTETIFRAQLQTTTADAWLTAYSSTTRHSHHGTQPGKKPQKDTGKKQRQHTRNKDRT